MSQPLFAAFVSVLMVLPQVLVSAQDEPVADLWPIASRVQTEDTPIVDNSSLKMKRESAEKSAEKARLQQQLAKLIQARANEMTLNELREAVLSAEAENRRITAQRKLDRVAILLAEIVVEHPETPAAKKAKQARRVVRGQSQEAPGEVVLNPAPTLFPGGVQNVPASGIVTIIGDNVPPEALRGDASGGFWIAPPTSGVYEHGSGGVIFSDSLVVPASATRLNPLTELRTPFIAGSFPLVDVKSPPVVEGATAEGPIKPLSDWNTDTIRYPRLSVAKASSDESLSVEETESLKELPSPEATEVPLDHPFNSVPVAFDFGFPDLLVDEPKPESGLPEAVPGPEDQ